MCRAPGGFEALEDGDRGDIKTWSDTRKLLLPEPSSMTHSDIERVLLGWAQAFHTPTLLNKLRPRPSFRIRVLPVFGPMLDDLLKWLQDQGYTTSTIA